MNTNIEPDAVLEELWAAREALWRKYDYNIYRMGEAMRAKTAQLEREGRTIIY
jgi:hypothetical protein